jgi:hypothetical protein
MARRASDIHHSISKAIDFLYSSQLEYGEFQTYAWRDAAHSENGYSDSSPFATSLVLYSISYVKDARIQAIADKALNFLCSELEGHGLWRYWSSRNPLHTFLPPDLDSTCCISHVLKQYHQSTPNNHALILANRNRAGIFYTWMAARQDSPAEFVAEIQNIVSRSTALVLAFTPVLDNLDSAVNANVLLYLGENAETKCALEYIIQAARDEHTAPSSQYYLDRLSFYYMLSRAYKHSVSALGATREKILERVVLSQAEDGSWGNELLTALAVCTLLNFGESGVALGRGVEYLLQTQLDDGSWRRVAMYAGREPYYGSEELTTALAVQALARSV